MRVDDVLNDRRCKIRRDQAQDSEKYGDTFSIFLSFNNNSNFGGLGKLKKRLFPPSFGTEPDLRENS